MADDPRPEPTDEQTHDSERRLRSVLDALPVGVWLTDADGTIVVDNPTGARIWGVRHTGRAHMGTARAWWSDSGRPLTPGDWSLVRALTRGETSLNEVIDIETALGERKTILSSAVPLRDSAGRVLGAVVVNEDISQLKAVEAALRESEARFRALADAIPAIVWTAAPDGTITSANAQWFQYCGLTPEENARGWPQLVLHPDDRERCLEQWASALREGTDYEIEVRNRRFDGEYRWFLTRAVPIRDTGGYVIAWFGTTTDIHERKEADAALRESEQRYRAIAETANEGIWLVDSDARTTFINRRMAEILGRTVEEIAGRTVLEFVFEEDRPLAQERIGQNLRGRSEQFDFRFRRADGTAVLVLAGTSPVTDAAGRVVGALGMFSDITERKRAEERTAALQSLAARLSQSLTAADVSEALVQEVLTALGGSAGAVGLVTDDGAAVSVLASVGYPDEFVQGWQRVPLARPVLYTDAIRERRPLWIESRRQLEQRYPFARAVLSVGESVAAVPLQVGERILGVIGISFAETRRFSNDERAFVLALAQQCAQALERARLYEAERQARADAQAALEMRDQFLAAISHDLRTPLTAIKGMTQALKRQARQGDPLSPDTALNGLAIIERSATTLTAMVTELVDLSHLESGQLLELDVKPTDLVALARRCVEEAQQTTIAHTIHVEAAADRLTGEWDRDRLSRVLANLLSNAIKYSPNGGEIAVTLAAEGDGGARWARLSVRDHGVGIPTADLPHVFDRFYRGANVAGRIAGTGIGLAGSRQIVEQHGGSIEVASNEGAGSTFTVRLPLRNDER